MLKKPNFRKQLLSLSLRMVSTALEVLEGSTVTMINRYLAATAVGYIGAEQARHSTSKFLQKTEPKTVHLGIMSHGHQRNI
jgi:hypothetical protein